MSDYMWGSLEELPEFKPGDAVVALCDGGRDEAGLPRQVPIRWCRYILTSVFYTEYGLGCSLKTRRGGAVLDPAPYKSYVLAFENDRVWPMFIPEDYVYWDFDGKFHLRKELEKREPEQYGRYHPFFSYSKGEMSDAVEKGWKNKVEQMRDAKKAEPNPRRELEDKYHQMQKYYEKFADELFIDDIEASALVRDMLTPQRNPKSKKEKKYARPKELDNSHPRSPRARRA